MGRSHGECTGDSLFEKLPNGLPKWLCHTVVHIENDWTFGKARGVTMLCYKKEINRLGLNRWRHMFSSRTLGCGAGHCRHKRKCSLRHSPLPGRGSHYCSKGPLGVWVSRRFKARGNKSRGWFHQRGTHVRQGTIFPLVNKPRTAPACWGQGQREEGPELAHGACGQVPGCRAPLGEGPQCWRVTPNVLVPATGLPRSPFPAEPGSQPSQVL